MDDPQNFGDEKLVALCQQGQKECFEILVRRYMTKAFHIAFDFTRDTETAKDLSQDAFMRAYANIKVMGAFHAEPMPEEMIQALSYADGE